MVVININDFNNHKIKESTVVKRIIGGEKELFEILVRRNNQKLYRVIRMYLKADVDIQDVMQNTYLKAFTKLYQFKLKSSFSTWLIRIGINEALARINEKSIVFNLNEQIKDFDSNSVLEIQDQKQSNPQDKMIERETKHLLEKAIDNLEIKYREVYMLKEVEEMSSLEVAKILNITVANVKVRLHRAKAMLKDGLYELSNDKNIFEFGFRRCDRIAEYVMNNI
ncbi:RNA polymerase sigma factor [Tenacibaculum ovolyticum]|uniref:RNA polymerase sigma factor n=1 Tax=Tenacibaculum ovolyticum TaxID=104270 RepID=UPI003BAD4AFD